MFPLVKTTQEKIAQSTRWQRGVSVIRISGKSSRSDDVDQLAGLPQQENDH
jgi:hypothetical protein